MVEFDLEKRTAYLLEGISSGRIKRTRNLVAKNLRSVRHARSVLKKQETTKDTRLEYKLKRVLNRCNEIGYKFTSIMRQQGRESYIFTATHGGREVTGEIKVGISFRGTTLIRWAVGSCEDPSILLEGHITNPSASWRRIRVIRISYFSVMRTTNEILQVLLQKKKR